MAPVSHDELSQAEQQIIRTAVEEGFYHACPDLPEAVWTLAEHVERADYAYLAYQGTRYSLWIRIQDQVFATTASAPENDPSCGLI